MNSKSRKRRKKNRLGTDDAFVHNSHVFKIDNFFDDCVPEHSELLEADCLRASFDEVDLDYSNFGELRPDKFSFHDSLEIICMDSSDTSTGMEQGVNQVNIGIF